MKSEELAGFPGKLKGVIYIYTYIKIDVHIFICSYVEEEDGSRKEFAKFLYFIWYAISSDNVTDVWRLLHIYFLLQTELLLK